MHNDTDNLLSSKSSNIKIYAVIMLACIAVFLPKLQNDCFWLIKIGEHIVERGFPVTEPLTYHTGLYYPVQQWLSAVIFFIIHKYFSFTGLYALTLLFSIFISIATYKLCMLLSNESKVISISIVLISTAIMMLVFAVPRPQIFSYLIFILEIMFLEKHLKTNRYKYIVFIVLLSIILINLHAALWVFFFLLFIPYLFDGIPWITNLLSVECHNKNKVLSLAMFTCLLSGFINPYGVDNILYSLNSFGTGTDFIGEMLPPHFGHSTGIILFIYLCLLFAVYTFFNGKTTIRFALITLGTVYMSLLSYRNFALLVVCSVPLLAYYLKDFIDTDKDSKTENQFPLNKFLVFMVSFIVANSICVLLNIRNIVLDKSIIPDKAVDYIMQNIDISEMKLYNGFNTGGYLEFRGIKPFIDSRAEVFTKNINKKEDILTDEINLYKRKVYYQDIFDKYGFTHWLIDVNFPLNNFMSRDNRFKKIYEDEQFVIYTNVSKQS